MKRRTKTIRALAAELVALQTKARALGIFTDDRELIECPNCGLAEDVNAVGQLITCRPPADGQDTGLRFRELPRNHFRCPACGASVREPGSVAVSKEGKR
jgi:rubredoxin